MKTIRSRGTGWEKEGEQSDGWGTREDDGGPLLAPNLQRRNSAVIKP